jgi:predicted nucleotidyltransferase
MVVPTGLAAPVASTLPVAIQRIVEAVQPIKIVLFGSYAYGTPTPDSDVDLLVILETSASRVERYAMISDVLRPRQFPVDILVKTPDELRQALLAGDPYQPGHPDLAIVAWVRLSRQRSLGALTRLIASLWRHRDPRSACAVREWAHHEP